MAVAGMRLLRKSCTSAGVSSSGSDGLLLSALGQLSIFRHPSCDSMRLNINYLVVVVAREWTTGTKKTGDLEMPEEDGAVRDVSRAEAGG